MIGRDLFAPRLLAFFGSDRSRCRDAAALQKHSGVAPLTKQSGKTHFVHRRYACNKFLRQTFVEWAAQTVIKSLWAKAYCEQQKAKGQRHQSILRDLAFKWQRILYRCWQNREAYDESRYLHALRKSSSPLIPLILEMTKSSKNPVNKIHEITCQLASVVCCAFCFGSNTTNDSGICFSDKSGSWRRKATTRPLTQKFLISVLLFSIRVLRQVKSLL